MAGEGDKSSILFSVHIPVPNDEISNSKSMQNSTNKRHLETEPTKEENKKGKNLDVIMSTEADQAIEGTTTTPIDHPVPLDPALILSNYITNLVGGKKIELIIEKSLEKADLDRHQARLSMPKSHILREFLTKDEEEWLDQAKKQLPVMVIDPCLSPHAMKLSKWRYRKKHSSSVNEERIDQLRGSWSYMLISGWNGLREANASFLKQETVIQVWSFRVEDMLGLGIALKFD